MYAILGIVLWQIPVFDRLHVESGAVVAAVSFFLAGWSGARKGLLLPQLLWPLVVVAMLLASLFWAPNCDILRGGGLFVVLVWPSVILGWTLGHWAQTRTTRPVFWTYFIGALVLFLGPIYDVGLHPQFYSYNHVFGAVLGPIYDEDLVVRTGLFVFRGMSLLWAVVLMAWARGQTRLLPIPVLILGVLYAQPGRSGINTTERYVQSQFSGHAQTPHFNVFFDTTAVPPAALEQLLEDHEWQYERLRRLVGVEPGQRVLSFVYPDNASRARLTGARTTSVAPVWLRTPQVHVSLPSVTTILPHELAHVFSREFGMPVINASPLVGLVEGFAVAVEPPTGSPTPEESVLAAHPDNSERQQVAAQVARALSPWGFWSGRAGVSYTWTGAFVHHLIETRGMDAFRRVYRSGDFNTVYGQPVDELMDAWARDLPTWHASLPGDARAISQRRFSVPSLFEQTCPHWVPRPVRAYRKAMAAADTSGLRTVWQRWPDFHDARLGWAALVLPGADSTVSAVLEAIPQSEHHAVWHYLAGWAAAQEARMPEAHAFLLEALALSRTSDRHLRFRILEQLHGMTPEGLEGAYQDEWLRLQSLNEIVQQARDGDLDTAKRVGQALVQQSRLAGDFGMAALAREWLDRIEWRRSYPSDKRGS